MCGFVDYVFSPFHSFLYFPFPPGIMVYLYEVIF